MAPAETVELPLRLEPGTAPPAPTGSATDSPHHRGIVARRAGPGPSACPRQLRPRSLLARLSRRGGARSCASICDGAYRAPRLRVDGMDCADCAQTIERAVSRLDGVTHVAVSFPARRCGSSTGRRRRARSRGRDRVARLGYRVEGAGQRRRARRPLRAGPPRATTLVVGGAAGARARASTSRTRSRPLVPFLRGGDPRRRLAARALGLRRPARHAPARHQPADGDRRRRARPRSAPGSRRRSWSSCSRSASCSRGARSSAPGASSPASSRSRRRRPGCAAPRNRRLAPSRRSRCRSPSSPSATRSWCAPASGSRSTAASREGASAVDQAPITGESTPVDKAAGRRRLRRHAQRPGPARRARSTTAPGDTTLDRIAQAGRRGAGAQVSVGALGRLVRALCTRRP